MSVGVCLSCGVGMLLVAAMMSAILNYNFLIMWEMNYGLSDDSNTYIRQSPREIEKIKSQQKDKGKKKYRLNSI